jgi:hypothetical protein
MASAVAVALGLGVALAVPAHAGAQGFETLGTRAGGMGGAFVAVADDATAVYWNPAGLALSGALFSLAMDTGASEAAPDDLDRAGRRSGSLLAFGTPPLGLSYYRLSATSFVPDTSGTGAAMVRLQRLTTHHAGITLVQSLTGNRSTFNVALGTTLKLVHGIGAAGLVDARTDRDELLDEAGLLPDESNTTFDADIGLLASFGTWRAGITARNVREPEFDAAEDAHIELTRQTRAGLAYVGVPGLIVSADIDLERSRGSLGEVRNFAAGAEAQLFPRAFVRSGFRVNTLSDQPGGRAAVYSLGGGYAVFRSFVVDAHATLGSEAGNRGWGVSGRLLY